MLPYIQLGPLRLWSYGLMLAFGLWEGYYFFREEIRRRKLPVNSDFLMFEIALAGIVGAKLYHVIVTLLWTEHQAFHWSDLVGFGGLAWNGGLIAGFATLLWYARSHRVSVWSLLDAASPAAAIGYAFGRLGCFLAGDGDYGKPTDLPWGMSFPHGVVPTTQRVHPTPLYEIAGGVLLFFVLRRLAKRDLSPGTIFAVYLVGSGVFRFAVEFIRINPPFILGLTEAQCVSLLAVACGSVLLARSRSSALAAAH
jgi:phosphatidylglycerol---prolipoprotein diacylglyceryl transferase